MTSNSEQFYKVEANSFSFRLLYGIIESCKLEDTCKIIKYEV